MGHDIYAVNKAKEAVAYIRFSMGNYTSYDFYRFFKAMDYHGGVSGIGASANYTVSQIEQAYQSFIEQYGDKMRQEKDKAVTFEIYERNEMKKFIQTCLTTAKQEGTVKINYC